MVFDKYLKKTVVFSILSIVLTHFAPIAYPSLKFSALFPA